MKSKALLLSKSDQDHKLETLGSLIMEWAKDLDVDFFVSHEKDAIKKLKDFDICLLCITTTQLSDEEEQSLMDFVKSGKSLFAFHSASVMDEKNAGYIDLLGARFVTHSPYHEFQVNVVDTQHPITKGMKDFKVSDELYILDREPKDAQILMTAFWENKNQPMLYVKKYGEGKVIYNAMGHDEGSFTRPEYRQLTAQAISWLITITIELLKNMKVQKIGVP